MRTSKYARVPTTRAQRESLAKLHQRNTYSDSYAGETYLQFRRRLLPGYGYVGIALWGMFIGIEPDGYCHS
jgi:hypothetical protein